MSDDKKKEAPLKDPKVGVDVVPKDSRSKDHRDAAKKVAEKLKEKIDQAVSDNKSGGKEKQFDAAEAEVDKAADGTDNRKIEKIKVLVEGKDDAGNDVAKGWGKKPKEGKPNP